MFKSRKNIQKRVIAWLVEDIEDILTEGQRQFDTLDMSEALLDDDLTNKLQKHIEPLANEIAIHLHKNMKL